MSGVILGATGLQSLLQGLDLHESLRACLSFFDETFCFKSLKNIFSLRVSRMNEKADFFGGRVGPLPVTGEVGRTGGAFECRHESIDIQKHLPKCFL